jgi:hypothetical protein
LKRKIYAAVEGLDTSGLKAALVARLEATLE